MITTFINRKYNGRFVDNVDYTILA